MVVLDARRPHSSSLPRSLTLAQVCDRWGTIVSPISHHFRPLSTPPNRPRKCPRPREQRTSKPRRPDTGGPHPVHSSWMLWGNVYSSFGMGLGTRMGRRGPRKCKSSFELSYPFLSRPGSSCSCLGRPFGSPITVLNVQANFLLSRVPTFTRDARHARASTNASRRAGHLPCRQILAPGCTTMPIRHARTPATTNPLRTCGSNRLESHSTAIINMRLTSDVYIASLQMHGVCATPGQ